MVAPRRRRKGRHGPKLQGPRAKKSVGATRSCMERADAAQTMSRKMKMDTHLPTSINGARHARDGLRQRPGERLASRNEQRPTEATRRRVEVAREGCRAEMVKTYQTRWTRWWWEHRTSTHRFHRIISKYAATVISVCSRATREGRGRGR